MKPFIPILLVGALAYQPSICQITTPVVKANFGIEADVSSNFYNNAPQPAVDDWFTNNFAGTGQFVIDTTGAAAMLAGYISNPSTLTRSFSRLMSKPGYSLVNNRLLLDAIFHRDFHGDDSTIFASGSNKNGMSPASWSCPVSQSIPDKNDILDAYTHVRRAGPNVTDSLWMFSAIAIENTTGSRYFDFELYQTNFAYNRPTRTFVNFGPDAGHTSWQFDAAGNIVRPGDIIFTAEFGSGGLTLVQARVWINKASLAITPTAFSWGGQFDGDGSAATFGYASIVPKTAGAFYTGLQTATNTVWTGPFRLVRDNNAVVSTFQARQFMEFSINLTKLGIDPSRFANNGCGTPFRRVMIKTRASTSFTAELKDFIAPFSLFNYAAVDATTDKTYYCRTMETTTINVFNPLSTSIYTWSTTNGNIIGTTTGTSITVNQPGTYYVSQQLHTQCPAYAVDSVKISFDTACTLLDVNITRFSGSKNRNNCELSWAVDHNDMAASFAVEYSTDNRSFVQAGNIPATDNSGQTSYRYSHRMPDLALPVLYYRIAMTDRNGNTRYSQPVAIRYQATAQEGILVYPNPVSQKAWISVDATEATKADIMVTDGFGRTVLRQQVQLQQGPNSKPIEQINTLRPGVYQVTVRTGRSIRTFKILVVS